MEKFNTQARAQLAKRIRLMSALCLFVVLLGACSTVRIGYNHANSLVYWWLDGYIDFRPDQLPAVKRDIDSLLDWHRKTQLPQYVQFLTQVQRQIQNGLSHAELQADYDQVAGFSRVMLLKATPELTDLALSLRAEQLDYLEKRFQEDRNAIKAAMRDTPESGKKRRFEAVLKRAEYWLGSFSGAQEKAIRLLSDRRPSDGQFWLEERMAQQQGLLALLHRLHDESPPRDDAIALVQQFIASSLKSDRNPAQKAYFDAYYEASMQIVLGIIKTAKPSQKIHAVRKIRAWVDDASFLAAHPVGEI
jgi:hypothetical protein